MAYFDELMVPYIESYSDYLRSRGSTSPNTRMCVRYAIQSLDEFIHAMDNARGALSATREDVLRWKQYLELKHSSSTLETNVYYLYAFFRWLVSIGKLAENPIPQPKTLIFLGKEPKDPLVLEPKHVFALRRCRQKSLRCAMAFEFLLSTGFRFNELSQTRACDVTFGKTPMDHELQAPSPYYGACVMFNAKLQNSKTGTNRTCYLGMLAARLLRAYMTQMRIPEKSVVPIFPFHKGALTEEVREYMDPILEEDRKRRGAGGSGSDSQTQDHNTKMLQRTQGYQDVDLSRYNIDARLAKSIANRAKKESMLPLEQQKDVTKKVENRMFSPHCMRHTFAAIQHYRHYSGAREDIGKVMLSLGHTSTRLTFDYLKHTNLVNNDAIWNRLIMGTNLDWPNVWMK